MKLTEIFNRPDKIAGFLVVLLGVAWGTGKFLVDPDGTHSLLMQNNYTKIETGGYAWGDCSDTSFIRTRFTAISPDGKRVSGAVCQGVRPRIVVRVN